MSACTRQSDGRRAIGRNALLRFRLEEAGKTQWSGGSGGGLPLDGFEVAAERLGP